MRRNPPPGRWSVPLVGTFEGSLALVLFVALIDGALVSLLAPVPAIMKGR